MRLYVGMSKNKINNNFILVATLEFKHNEHALKHLRTTKIFYFDILFNSQLVFIFSKQ